MNPTYLTPPPYGPTSSKENTVELYCPWPNKNLAPFPLRRTVCSGKGIKFFSDTTKSVIVFVVVSKMIPRVILRKAAVLILLNNFDPTRNEKR